jgi:uncharacterized membrane protein YkvA (DUF1232 family)
MNGQLRILRLIYHLPNFVRLFWRLLRDPRVPIYKKVLPVIAGLICFAYVVFPFDVLPDPYAFVGQLDDVTVILLIMAPSIWLFVRICPRELVKEHTHHISENS